MGMSSLGAIRRVWLKSPGDYFCISTKEVKKRNGKNKWKDTFFKRREITKAISFAKKHMKTHDVYMTTHGFSKPQRLKEHSIDPNFFYADLDEADPRTLDIKPTYAYESSPGRYVGYWLTDKPVNEEMNKRLSYHIGADASGWDRTQVLRIPGTINHKYKAKPRVNILWDDGPQYQISKLDKLLPPLTNDKGKEVGGEATEIYSDYEKSMPQWLRRELTNPQVERGKRSEVLWKMINKLMEIGMSKDEIFTLLWDNAWNKHAERRGGERQLENEIDKALGNHVGGSKKLSKKSKLRVKKKPRNAMSDEHRGSDDDEDPTKKRFTFTTMEHVKQEDIPWIIERMMAPRQTTMWEGDPGVGKSYFLMWICIALCNGDPLPWEDPKKHKRKPMRVLYCDMENSAGAVTKNRLIDNGLKRLDNYVQLEQPFSVSDPDSIDALAEQVLEVFKPDVVIIDPINMYVGSADTYKASETQQALQVFKDLAEEFNFSLNLVRHLNKSHGGKALYAGGGSIAFAGVARIIATIGWHPEEPDMRVVACTKNNLTQPFGSMGYIIQGLPDTIKRKNRSKLEYAGHVDFTSDDILGTTNQKDESSKNIASDLIREMMGDEKEVNYHAVLQAADTRSISETTLKKAAAELGLTKVTKGRGATRRTYLRKKKD